jgi:hypothetical protein
LSPLEVLINLKEQGPVGSSFAEGIGPQIEAPPGEWDFLPKFTNPPADIPVSSMSAATTAKLQEALTPPARGELTLEQKADLARAILENKQPVKGTVAVKPGTSLFAQSFNAAMVGATPLVAAQLALAAQRAQQSGKPVYVPMNLMPPQSNTWIYVLGGLGFLALVGVLMSRK